MAFHAKMDPKVTEFKVERPDILCDFCHTKEIDPIMLGPMFRLENITMHYFCLLFSSAACQNGKDAEGIWGFLPKDIRKELTRGKPLRCAYCRGRNASIGCCVPKCKVSMHYPCGLRNGGLFQFQGVYESFCFAHRSGRGSQAVKTEGKHTEEICPICFLSFDVGEWAMRPNCCKGRLMHHRCLMNVAANAGLHFFRCPLCQDEEKFPFAMLKSGIFAPDQDAAWEVEQGAFEDLKQAYNRCDGEPCLCPNGREYNSDKRRGKLLVGWKLISCEGCSGSAVHYRCGNLNSLKYLCELCAKVLLEEQKDKKSVPAVGVEAEAAPPGKSKSVAEPEKTSEATPQKRKVKDVAGETKGGFKIPKKVASESERLSDGKKKNEVAAIDPSTLALIDKAVEIFAEKYSKIVSSKKRVAFEHATEDKSA